MSDKVAEIPHRKYRTSTNPLHYQRIRRIWDRIILRCYDLSNSNYSNYGGRGITMCDEWRNNFMSFFNWSITNGYSPDLTIDRIKNEFGYYPENCRWSTQKEQQNNKTNNRLIEIDGKTKTMSEWSDISGISYETIKRRVNVLCWPVEKAIFEPVYRLKRKVVFN